MVATSAAQAVPSSSVFSFKAPFPITTPSTSLKQRRVSLASQSSPRVVQPWSFRDEMGLDVQSSEVSSPTVPTEDTKGKMRNVDSSTVTQQEELPSFDKKPRKKWTPEETMMLVRGCQTHGVGNWKTILQDSNLEFQERSAVDLKDRFRTYFPDAYKKHYPNAKTHLSNKIRSTFPDGTSLFEKTRSKRRRPFTEAEDAALKAGYEKHGTTWATIVKDPIFQEQNRRSTDLRDRFRNAFPHLYQAAGYKPRTTAKKRMDGPVRAADDNLDQISTTGPVRSRRRAHSRTGLLRGGTKSVPQSTACSEDEDSSAGEDDEESSPFKVPAPPVPKDSAVFPTSPLLKASPPSTDASTPASNPPAPISPLPPPVIGSSNDSYMQADVGMDVITIEPELTDFAATDSHSDIEAWSSASGVNTPTHSTAAWSLAGASPASSHLSDFLLNPTTSNNASNVSSPFLHRRNDGLGGNMIGKSAWGQDWFLPNPRLDSSSAGSNLSSIDNGFSPASPFTFHPHLNHGVLDRYDLFPPSIPNDFSSEAGLGDSHATFSDDHNSSGVMGASPGGTGFRGYHSQFAGDLISGVGSRVQSFGGPNLYSFTSGGNEILGLGLEGIPEDAGIHPMQIDSHTSSFSTIDELGLTGITLNDNFDSSTQATTSGNQHRGGAMHDELTDDNLSNYGLSSPTRSHRHDNEPDNSESSIINHAFSLEDLVDMSNDLHETPPATPIMAHSRPLRRSSQGAMLNNFDSPNAGSIHHARSISVPPSEARNPVGGGGGGQGGMNVGGTMSMDDVVVGLQIQSQLHGQQHTLPNSSQEMTLGKGLQSLFGVHTPLSARSSPPTANLASRSQRVGRSPEPMRAVGGNGSLLRHSSMTSPRVVQQQHHQQPAQPATLFPAQLMMSSTTPAITPPSPSSHGQNTDHQVSHTQGNDFWRVPAFAPSDNSTWINSNSITSNDLYNVPYLDLHYTYGFGGLGSGNVPTAANDPSNARQGQEALDLAQPASLSSSGGMSLSNLGLNLAFNNNGNGGNNNVSHKVHDVSAAAAATIRLHPHLSSSSSSGLTLNKSGQQPPSDTFSSVAAAIAAANAVGQRSGNRESININSINNNANNNNSSNSNNGVTNTLDLNGGTGTIRQSHFKSANHGGGLGRSMSHHRGHSAVCPQDLDLGIKRKRLSWDGGLV